MADDATVESTALRGVSALLSSLGDRHASGAAWAPHSTSAKLRMTIVSAATPGVSAHAFRATALLPYAPGTIFTALGDLRAREKWDSNIARLDSRPVGGGAGGAGSAVFYSATKAVGPISGREFLDATWRGAASALPTAELRAAAPAGALVNCGCGLPEGHVAFPPDARLVRGLNHPSGWIFEPLDAVTATTAAASGPPLPANSDGWTRATYLVQPELKGWMPSAVINATLAGMYTTFFSELLAAMSRAALAAQ
jgi:hypothetical protein